MALDIESYKLEVIEEAISYLDKVIDVLMADYLEYSEKLVLSKKIILSEAKR